MRPDLAPIAEMVRRHDHDRFQTGLFAPARKRNALFALYAFNYEIARVRETVTEPMLGQIRLQWWREVVETAYAGTAPRQHVVAIALTEAIREFALTRSELDRLIDSRERDLDPAPPPTLAALEDYAEGSSAPLAILALEVLGERKVAGLRVNLDSMALVSNIHRASAAIRDHFERFVLTEADLHWSAFVTLWCLWIYGELETRKLALEAGVAKSTLSGILNTLEARKLVRRRTNEAERRLVIVNLTTSGNTLIASLFPRFNGEETRIVGGLPSKQRQTATDALRSIIATIDEIDGPLRDD